MTKHPPNRRGISFEVGAQLEARDRLKKWYAAHIEEINFEEGKVLIHFKRWNHRHDEWFCWDSPYLRPLEKIQLRKEGLLEEEGSSEFHVNEQVLACWSDCRFYPAKIISANKDGTYTVKFFDGVVQTVKNIHVKAYPKDENDITKDKLKEKRKGSSLDTDKKREKFKEQKKSIETTSDKDESTHTMQRRSKQLDKQKTRDVSEKTKTPEKTPSVDGKEDKENILENEKESSVEKSENDIMTSQDNQSHSSPPSDTASQTLQPITLELRRRKISIGTDVHSKRLRLEKPLNQETKIESHVPSERESNNCASDSEREQIKQSSEPSCERNHETLLVPVCSAETEVVKDASPSAVEPEEEVQQSPVKPMLPSSLEEAQQSPLLPETRELAKNDPSQEESVENKTPAQLQEVPAVTVTNALKKLNELKPEEPADLDQNKFKCKYMDCSKFFRKAKLLFYHMKYFHGLEKTAEQEQKPVPRNIQTRGSSTSEKTNRESPKRRRTTSESLSPVLVTGTPAPQNQGIFSCIYLGVPAGTDAFGSKYKKDKKKAGLTKKPKLKSHVPSERESNNCASDSEREQIKQSSEPSCERNHETLLVPVCSAETEVVKDASPSAVEPEEEVQQSPVKPMLPSSLEEAQQSPLLPETRELAKNDPSQEESVENKTPAQLQEVPAVTVTNALKKLNELKPEEPADLDQNKFKCKYMDCSKFFRKAKLLFYHMKYFHGLEKTAEQEQKPVPRNIQTRGSSTSEKTNRESPKRRRTTSESLYTASQTLQPITLELRRRKISIGTDVHSKRLRLEKPLNQETKIESHVPSERESNNCASDSEREQIKQSSLKVQQSPVKPMLPSSLEEAQQSPLLPETRELAKNDPSQEESVENKTPAQLQEVPAVTAPVLPYEILPWIGEKQQSKNRSQYQETSKQEVLQLLKRPIGKVPKRRRTTSESLYGSHHIVLRRSPTDDKTKKLHVKRRNSVPSSVNMLNTHRPLLREKSKENQMDKSHRKQTDREKHGENAVQEKEKNKEKKYKNFLKLKLKKKKRKKSKSEYCGSEENIDISWELSSKLLKSSIVRASSCSPKTMPLHSSDTGYHRDKPKIKEEDTLSNLSTDSALWSDEEFDATMTNPDHGPSGEKSCFEIVRCMCETQEENEFMIQCEECLCWQHGVCMGLLEETVPEKYTCYICRNPPGQRASLKYWYDKEWLSHGCMHGLAFLEDNYSHQNAKKIVTTHQLLGDVQRVIEVLHGLQLKMKILQCKEHPDLKLWCQPWKHLTGDEKTYVKHNLPVQEKCCREEMASYRTFNGGLGKPSVVASLEESYITSEHCYQKPRAYYPAVEQRLVVETRTAAMADRVNRIRENRDDAMERFCWELDRDVSWIECEPKQKYCKVRECVKKASSENALEMKLLECSDGILKSQLNLLTHVEFLQDEVTHRMDFIEKELDVLESFLDYTGDLEPPEPLARLPQLKRRIRQLLLDLSKVQQLTLHCSTYEHCQV
uniref:PHD finger protein 20 n=1 Tax=Geotrypetes seraphini TaxID=260995 RepID=A0A6P8SIF0_GEOSA|nr:PHD finger protein 20 [Geotrypetes seraphini]